MWRRQFPRLFFRGEAYFPQKPVFCCANLVQFGAMAGESEINYGTFALKSVPEILLAAENQKPKASLSLFLKKQGSINAAAVRTVGNSGLFIGHKVPQLRPLQKYEYLVGRELTSNALLEEHRRHIVVPGAVQKLTNSRPKKRCFATVPLGIKTALNSKQKITMARVSETTGKLPSNIIYLKELGMEQKQIERATSMFPYFASLSVERNLRPLVDFFLDIGVPKADIPSIIIRHPRICALRLVENIMSKMTFLKSLGVDKKKWGKVIYKCPALLCLSRGRMSRTVVFFCKMGVPVSCIGKIISDFPCIICCSIENNLQPTADYFESLGVNVKCLLCAYPQIFGLSIEQKLKPVTRFFLERGFSTAEIGTMVSRFGSLYSFSLAGNLTPKWEFFLTMNYSRLEILKFPTYFGYSLEQRIKPRYALVKDCGVNMPLSHLLIPFSGVFHKALERKQ